MAMADGWQIIQNNLDVFLAATGVTVQVAVFGLAIGFVGGVILALSRLSSFRPLSCAATLYIEIIRGTPLLIQIFFIYFGFSAISPLLNFDAMTAGILALGFNSSAYQAEIIRGGIESVPKGQMEAARSIGMTRMQAMRFIILPQSFRLMIPAMTNEMVTLIKDTSLVSTITVVELTFVGKQLTSRYLEAVPILSFVALIYLILTFATSRAMRYLEKKYQIPGYGEAE
jgi:His/Glu/Gln/Arg/opine family amino acid ABC transporter permease subunit